MIIILAERKIFLKMEWLKGDHGRLKGTFSSSSWPWVICQDVLFMASLKGKGIVHICEMVHYLHSPPFFVRRYQSQRAVHGEPHEVSLSFPPPALDCLGGGRLIYIWSVAFLSSRTLKRSRVEVYCRRSLNIHLYWQLETGQASESQKK